MKKIVDREMELATKFNDASAKIFKSKVKYVDLGTLDLIKLKNALSNIHNIITMKVTQAFIDKLQKDGVISEDQATRMKEVVNGTSANANGYDVRHDKETKLGEVKKFVNGDKNILAEVKCNLPVYKNTFGSDQKKGIEKDIDGLLGSVLATTMDTKSTIKSSFDNSEYYKFMVFLKYDNEEGKSVENSVDNLKKNLEEGKYKEKLDYYERIRPSEIKKDKVYIVFVEI